MKEFIEFIAKALVDYPDAVNISETSAEDGSTIIRLVAAQEDLGRIVGRQGRTAKAMRVLLNAKAARQNKRVFLQIVE